MKLTVHRWFLVLVLAIASCTAFAQITIDPPPPPPPPPPPCDTEGPGRVPRSAKLICDNGIYIDEATRCEGWPVKVPNICREEPRNPPEDMTYPTMSTMFYRFKCYSSGTFGFVANTTAPSSNLDWQIYDITNYDPMLIYVNTARLIAANWSTNTGHTGTTTPSIPFFVCRPRRDATTLGPYSEMPDFIKGHEYMLMITGGSSGETIVLDVSGGTAVIRDPLDPHLEKAAAHCSGTEILLRFNKEMLCSSITSSGSEFTVVPGGATVVSASALNCTSNSTFVEMSVKLSARLTDGNYKLLIRKGTDGNTILDACSIGVPVGEEGSFNFVIPKPILADSIGKPACVPDSIRLYFPKAISCASISPGGTDFSIVGPEPVLVKSASGNCVTGKTEYVIIKFDQPIRTKGIYSLTLKPGDDGTVIIDECGEESPPQTISFNVADTVNADFTYNIRWGCQRDTVTFTHDAAHDVNKWNWTFNNQQQFTRQPTLIWPAKSKNQIFLKVSNGTCIDSAEAVLEFDNAVTAAFSMDPIICPEDKLTLRNSSVGEVDRWKWSFDMIGNSGDKEPLPFNMPNINRQMYYTIRLTAFNNEFNCSDSTRQVLTVLDNCLIGVPNAFTPNNDGLNDFFWPHNAIKTSNYEFTIYNRMGQLLFRSQNWQQKWDGRFKGEMQNTGVYVWMLTYIHKDTGKSVSEKGTVTLIR